MVERNRGTPQGGVVSPILANLFVHYAFDAWMARRFPDLAWCRYADDGLVHCRSEEEARTVREALAARLAECRLQLHPTKTKVVYCKDDRRRSKHEAVRLSRLRLSPSIGLGAALAEAVLRVHPGGQQVSAERDAGDDPGFEHSHANSGDVGRHRRRTQPEGTGLDRLLWAIYPFSALSDGSLHQPDAGRLVEAEIQALPPTSGTRAPLPCEDRA